MSIVSGRTVTVISRAERAGFDNVLIPSSFVPGMDPWTLASALAPSTTATSASPAPAGSVRGSGGVLPIASSMVG